MTAKSLSTDYQSALENVAYYPVEAAGYLRLAGEDRLDFLQRQVTNDVRLLSPSRTLETVLTTPTARIIEVFRLIDEGNTFALLTLPGRTASAESALKSQIFFMDKVTLEDHSAQWAHIDLEGPQARQALLALDVEAPTQRDIITSANLADLPIRLIAQPGLTAPLAFRLIIPADHLEALLDRLGAADVPELSAQTGAVLRVERALPAVDAELTAEYTPLETNLDALISDDKGCYTGQEVIARQINYDKITKRLVQLRLDDEASPGAVVRVDGKNVGAVTSVAHSPRFGPLALAVIKRPYHQLGQELSIETETAQTLGRVAALHHERSSIPADRPSTSS